METLYEEERNDRKIKIAAIVGAILSVTLLAAGIMAYLTDTHVKSNKFTLDSNLKIALTVPGWTGNAGDHMIIPTQSVNMEPKIQNKGSIPAWIAMKVEIPVYSGTLVGNTNAGIVHVVTDPNKPLDLYQYSFNQTKWKQIAVEEPSNDNGNKRIYTYVYTHGAADKGTLPTGNNVFADSLFTSIKALNVSGEQGDAITNPAAPKKQNIVGDIKLTAIAIQKTDNADVKNSEDAYAAYLKQELQAQAVTTNITPSY